MALVNTEARESSESSPHRFGTYAPTSEPTNIPSQMTRLSIPPLYPYLQVEREGIS